MTFWKALMAAALIVLPAAGGCAEEKKTVLLGIVGFNYTDLTISYFSVNGAAGGNIFVSSPTSGGGGTSCCAAWTPGTTLPKPLTVEWMRRIDGKDRWCKKTVQLQGPVPQHPSALAVHFMPNGDVEAEIAEGYPEVKLKLNSFSEGRRKESGNVVFDEKFASCGDER